MLISSGISISSVSSFRRLDTLVKNGFSESRKPTKLDDYTQFVPSLAVFVLDIVGIKGINTPNSQLVLLGLNNISTAVLLHAIKKITHRERPYGNTFNSFPSGHTATAFAAAEFLHQEYGHYSPWITIAGYTTAASTAYLRLYNNKHWLSDVLAGAAIGMATTKLVYWAHKRIKKSRNTGLVHFQY